jgi:hypothetical protein
MRVHSAVQRFALVFGIVYTIVGLLGFVPGLLQPPPADARPLAVGTAYGYLLGVFPVNVLHDIVHLGLGVLGVLAARRFDSARLYSRALAIVFGLLTVMGLVPGLDTTLGLIPLFGADVALHALSTVASAYFGWIRDESPSAEMAQAGASRRVA